MSDNNTEDENLGSYYMNRGAAAPNRKQPQEEPPKRRLPQGTLAVVAVLAFISIVWYAYPRGGDRYVDMDVPVVKADTDPVKVAPVDPGGMAVPHQDSDAFAPLEKNPGNGPEKILPSPEAPMDKSAALQSPDDAAAAKADASAAEVASVAAVPPQDTSAPKLDLTPAAPEAEKLVPPAASAAAAAVPAADTANTKAVAASYIQLGSYRDVAGAKKDWDWARKKYPGLLKNLSMHTEKVVLPAKGTFYRLQAGKVTEDRAREICAMLKTAVPGGCILVKGQK